MKTTADLLKEWFSGAREEGVKVGNTVGDEAAFLGVSAGHYSRIRNGKAPLSEEIINKILDRFAKDDAEREHLRAQLIEAQGGKAATPAPDMEEFSVEKNARLFDRLSRRGSLLCVDYRDLPQATPRGAYRKMAEKAGEAISMGLSFAMFQPFGRAEDILERQRQVAADFKKYYDAKSLLEAYSYLAKLAIAVREVYEFMKGLAGGGAEGHIVLYEAKVVPSIIACGINSRLFYAEYDDEDGRHHKEVYEWVVAASHPSSKHFFIERDQNSINVTAVSQQFYPIPPYWADNEYRLPDTDVLLKRAFESFGESELESGRDLWKVYVG